MFTITQISKRIALDHNNNHNSNALIHQCPKDVLLHIFSYVGPKSTLNISLTCKYLEQIGQDQRLWKLFCERSRFITAPTDGNFKAYWKSQATLPAMAFGREKWEAYIGTVCAEPPLPADIKKILKGPCPFWPGKKVEETHMLVLKVTAVNGKALSLDSLGELVQKPKKGNATKYDSFNTGQYKSNTPADASYWMLMTRDVIPGSRNKIFADEEKLLATYSQKAGVAYEVPSVLDATVCIFMEYVQSGTVLYSEEPWTFTRCREKYSADWQLAVGGFAPGGLRCHDFRVDHDSNGLGALRKFS